MKKIIGIFCFLLFVSYAFAERAVQTEMNSARYEIVQNPIARKYTFKLDKYTGNISQMVKMSDDEVGWESMLIISQDTVKYDEPVYQIVMGGYSVADTFLLNTKTGEVWQLVKGLFSEIWQKMKQ